MSFCNVNLGFLFNFLRFELKTVLQHSFESSVKIALCFYSRYLFFLALVIIEDKYYYVKITQTWIDFFH